MHTALMEASMDGHVEVARLLLDSGAQVSAKFKIQHAIHVQINDVNYCPSSIHSMYGSYLECQ